MPDKQDTGLWGEPKTPVDLTPAQAIEQGMRMGAYLKLEHGREHNARYHEFKRLVVARVAEDYVGTSKHWHIVVHMAYYMYWRGFVLNNDAQRHAEAAAAALEALGIDISAVFRQYL